MPMILFYANIVIIGITLYSKDLFKSHVLHNTQVYFWYGDYKDI